MSFFLNSIPDEASALDIEGFPETGQEPAGSVPVVERIESSMRTHCLQPDACKAKNVGKHCQGCNIKRLYADPAFQKKRLKALRKKTATAGFRAKQSAKMKRQMERDMQDPAKVQRMKEQGRIIGYMNLHLKKRQESSAKGGRTTSARRMAWCPREYWELNSKLRQQHIGLEERKRIIGDLAAKEAKTGKVERIAPEIAEARHAIAEFDRAQRARHARQQRDAY